MGSQAVEIGGTLPSLGGEGMVMLHDDPQWLLPVAQITPAGSHVVGEVS